MKTLSPLTASAPLAPLTAPAPIAPGTVWFPQEDTAQEDTAQAPAEPRRDLWANDPDRTTRLDTYRTF